MRISGRKVLLSVLIFVLSEASGGAIPRVSLEFSVSHDCVRGLPCVASVKAISLVTPDEVSLDDLDLLSREERRERGENFLRTEEAFPRFEFFNPAVPLGLEVLDASGRPVDTARKATDGAFFFLDPDLPEPPIFYSRIKRPMLSLRVGQTQEFVVDLWPWLKELPAGGYILTLLLFSDTTSEPWRSNALNITIEEVSGSVFSDIAGAIPALAEKGFDLTAEEWIDPNINTHRLQEALSPERFQVLALHAFLGEVTKNGSVDGAPVELLDELPSHLASLRQAIDYEIQRPGLTEPEAEQLSAQIRATFPGIGWRLDEVDQGRGLLNTAIKRLSN